MFRVVTDENFNNDILRALLLRHPNFDLVRVQDVGLTGADDPTILAWAAKNDRILLTHDRATMTDHANQRLHAGKELRGVFILDDRYPVGQAVDELLLIVAGSEQGEWSGRIVFLPL